MFRHVQGPPVPGGLVRSGMGTNISVVLHVLPYPAQPPLAGPTWLCLVQRAGVCCRGVLLQREVPAYVVSTQNIIGWQQPLWHPHWVPVHALRRAGMHCVVPGPACPADLLAQAARMARYAGVAA